MRKRIVNAVQEPEPPDDEGWLDLEGLAEVTLTSEDPSHPIEAALGPDGGGWRAAEPGPQTIRFDFDVPQRLRRIRLTFVEADVPRTQEFLVRWSPDEGRSFREIVRQQWNFSPEGATRETETYEMELAGVTVLELVIVPDVSGGPARASLHGLRLA